MLLMMPLIFKLLHSSLVAVRCHHIHQCDIILMNQFVSCDGLLRDNYFNFLVFNNGAGCNSAIFVVIRISWVTTEYY